MAQNSIDINVCDLLKLENLHINRNKVQLDINFLINYKNFCVFWKFVNVYLPNVGEKDMYRIKKRTPKGNPIAIHQFGHKLYLYL